VDINGEHNKYIRLSIISLTIKTKKVFNTNIYIYKMINVLNRCLEGINRIFVYIVNERFISQGQFYNCMTELLILFKSTFFEICNIYNKYILLPKLRGIIK